MQAVITEPQGSARDPVEPGATNRLGPPPEPRLTRFTRLAAELAGAPVALVTRVGRGGLVIASQVGLPGNLASLPEIPRSHSLCWAVAQAGATVALEDAREHPDYAGSGAVRDWGLVAYAGIPIRADDGSVAAVLSVADVLPRAWNGQVLSALAGLAGLVAAEMEPHRQIAERARLEGAFPGEQRFSHVLLDSSSDCVTLLDLQGRLEFINAPGLCLMELDDASGVLGEQWAGIWPGEGAQLARAAVDTALAGRTGRFQGCCPTRKGTPKWWDVSVTPVHDAAGALVRLLCVSRDVTEARHAEARLRHLQRMEAVGQLAGGVAHDFNNMLTAITGFASLLELGTDPAARELTYLREIQKAAARTADLTRQLLAFGRKQILRPHLMRLDQIVSGMEHVLRRLIGEHVTVSTVLAPGAVEVQVDPGQMEQVLLNLAVNARDAMPEGGTLTIETACAEVDERQARELGGEMTPGRYAVIAVSDTGVGMDPAILERIFEPFFTTREVGQGTGLGLSTVYGIVRQSEGHIFVSSEPGRGSRFTIYLPLSGAAPTQDPDAGAAAATGLDIFRRDG